MSENHFHFMSTDDPIVFDSRKNTFMEIFSIIVFTWNPIIYYSDKILFI